MTLEGFSTAKKLSQVPKWFLCHQSGNWATLEKGPDVSGKLPKCRCHSSGGGGNRQGREPHRAEGEPDARTARMAVVILQLSSV